MNQHPFSRTEMLLGKEGLACLYRARIAVFGLGGVGGYAVEALARSGVGVLDLFDFDTIDITNLNRQILATHKTIGLYKADEAKKRLLEINPTATVNAYKLFYSPETSEEVDLSEYDYICDAIDTLTGKIELAIRAEICGVPIISAMGAGNKMDASKFEVADIYQTSVCPLAKIMRHELRKRGVTRLKVVYSKEQPVTVPNEYYIDSSAKKRPPGSNAFVPAVVGLIMAGEVVNDIVSKKTT